MKYSEVEERCVYSVNFEKVRAGEFNQRHFAVVLKKNNDKATVIVAPLTSKSRGEGKNKVNIGKIDSLPPTLKGADSYAVYDQLRTLNVSRLSAILDSQGCLIKCPVEGRQFTTILELARDEIYKTLSREDYMVILKNKAYALACASIRDNVYKIKRTRDDGTYKQDLQEYTRLIESVMREITEYKVSAENVIVEGRKHHTAIEGVLRDCISGLLLTELAETQVS